MSGTANPTIRGLDNWAKPSAGPWTLAWRRFRRHRLALGGAGIIVGLGIASALAPVVSPYDPTYIDVLYKFAPPGQDGFLLGADELGRDVLTRLLFGGQVSLLVGLSTAVVTIIVGSIAGAVAGYSGGKVDNAIMRFADIMLCFPTLFLALVLAAFLGASLLSVTLIIAATSWMSVARLVRGQILSLREQDFITAARAIGSPAWRIIFKELLPNAMAPILVAATLTVANAILNESYLSFLGYGIQPPTPSWGNMLNKAQTYVNYAPWVAIFPGILITLTVTAFNVLGDGLRDALDPRMTL
ncbi:MAG: ABC transporter permease [Chloroflexota bacterium]